MPIRVFYSWQNDANPKTNRYFIRDALTSAIESVANDLQLSEADRPELDHDTANVPGSPDIFSTITEKIDRCDLFIADLSLVANVTDQTGKKYPNGNVAIEYGYALNRLGARRIIGVMNLEFGGIDDLPFDLKHKRAPIQYRLGSGDLATKPMVDGQRNRLVSELTNALRVALKEEVIPNLEQIPAPSVVQHKQNRGVF